MRPSDPRLRRQLAPAARPLAGVVATGVVASLLVIAQAWVVAGLVVAVVRHADVLPWATAAALLLAARGLVAGLGDVLAARAAALVGHDLRRRIVSAVLHRTATGAAVPSTGVASVAATRGVAAAEPYLTRYLPALVLAAVLPALVVAALATQDLLSTVIVLATLPLVPVFGALVGLATRDRAREQWRALESLSGHFLDVVRGLPTLVVHRRARAQSATIAAFTDRYRRASLATLRLAFASSAVLETVATISVALVAVVVGVRLAAGGLDLHTALVVLLLAPEAYWPLRRVGAEFHAAAEGIATFETVEELDTTPLPQHDDAGVPGRPLVLRDLVVTYAGRRTPALGPLDATLPATGLVAVTGPSGCGKSTLLGALAGLVPVTSGEVTRGGTPVGGPAWQEQVALLPQRPVFVAGTVADNLRLARPDASEDELWEALARVALEERVRLLPHGLDSDLAEDGADLSAGERARLALARAVLSRRPWLLLDEPTAHLDDLTSQIVLDTVVALAHDHAVVVVAHDPSLLDLADAVLALPAAPAPVAAPRSRPATARRTVVAEAPETVTPRRARARLLGATALGALASSAGVALTATAGWLIVQASTRPPVLTMLVAIVAVRTFGLTRPALRYAERLRSHDAALRELATRRVAVYDALVPLVPGGLGRRRGEALSSVVDDVDSLLDRELRVRMPVRGYAAVLALASLVATALQWQAGLVVLASGLVGGAAAYALPRLGAARVQDELVERRARLSDAVVDVVQTAPELATWQAGDAAVEGVVRASTALGRASTSASWWLGAGRAAALVAGGLGVAGTGLLAHGAVAEGTLGGPVAALLVLLPLALVDLSAPLADAGVLAARTAAAAERLDELTSRRPVVTETRVRPLPRGTDVVLDDVDAGWTREATALQRLSFSLPAGARVGVVGRSGSGKSTLAALLLRLLDPEHGDVRLGGTSTAWLGLDDVRGVVGLVDDDPHVFATTLVENVRLARPDAADAEVEDALRRAHLGPWLDALPDGLDTWLGDGHDAVSGGERARLGIARAVLAGHRVLVLDEPVAHLDHPTAAALARELLTGARERSVLWITHAPVGLEHLDAVVDLDVVGPRGRVGTVGPRSVG